MTRRLTQTHAAGPLFDDSAARSNAAPVDIAVAAPLCTLMGTSRCHRRCSTTSSVQMSHIIRAS